MIEAYQSFAMSLARQQHKKLPSFVLLEDIEASAMVGLWKAIERFDPSRQVPFESFARTKILGAILDDIREEDHSSRTVRDYQKEIRKVKADYYSENGRQPNNDEIAEAMGVDVEEIYKYTRRINEAGIVSLDTPIGEDQESGTLQDYIAYTEDRRAIDRIGILELALSPLSKRERLLFLLLYFEGLTLDQCAPILGMTHPMTCQMHFRISDKLEACYKRSKKG